MNSLVSSETSGHGRETSLLSIVEYLPSGYELDSEVIVNAEVDEDMRGGGGDVSGKVTRILGIGSGLSSALRYRLSTLSSTF